MIIEELVEEYLLQNGDVKSRNTERLMRIVARHFIAFAGNDATLLTDRNLGGFMRWRRNDYRGKKPPAEITITNEAAKLRALAGFAHQLGFVPPVRFNVRHNRPGIPTAMTQEQVRAMFDAARATTYSIGGVPGSVYFVALFSVAWDTGARANAIHELRIEDIDLERLQITFRVLKGNAPAVTKEIRPSTADAIRELLKHFDDVRPFAVVKSASIYHHLKRIKRAAGIPISIRNGLHDFRRAYATAIHAAGGDATEALGHSSDAVTRRWYIDPRQTKKQPLELLPDLSGGFLPRLRRWFNGFRTSVGM